MDNDMAPDAQAQSFDDEDIGNAHILKVILWQDWWKPLEEERPATPEPNWSISSSYVPVPTNNWVSALASNYLPPPKDSLLAQTGDISMFMDWHNVSNPLPLGGPPGQVTIKSDFFFNKDLEYMRFGSKGSRPTLSISKMKAAYYPDAGLEQMMPDQMWIKEEAVRTHMWILSVVRIEVFSMYRYDYMKKIVLRHADLNEHVIMERDFKYLYPSNFEDLYLLNLQGHLNHLPPKDKKILTTADRLGVQMIMRFNEIHKFNDGTLQQINKALDYRVNEFKINRMNPGLNMRAKRSSKIISLRHYSIMLASSHTVKSKTDIKSPTHYPCVGFNSLVHSFRALSTLRRSGLRTASTAAKPYQGDSLEFYLITGIPTVAAAGQRDVNSQLHAHTSNSLSRTIWQLKDLQHRFRNSDVCCYVQEKYGHTGPKVTTSQEDNTPQQG
nr:hypothetical protein [Tanacetum cinerariifolium]